MLLFLIALMFALPATKFTQADGREPFTPNPTGAPWEKACGTWCNAAKIAGGVGALAGVAYTVAHPKEAKSFFLNAPSNLKKQALKVIEKATKFTKWVGSKTRAPIAKAASEVASHA